MRNKVQNRVWKGLKDDRCPKCNNKLQTDGLFPSNDLVKCPECGFTLDKHTKEVLVERDYNYDKQVHVDEISSPDRQDRTE